jgi:outer membrane protein assembly factor BamA
MMLMVAMPGRARGDARPEIVDATPKRIVGFRVRGTSKLTETTASRLSHAKVGDEITPARIPELEAALLSSELFETVKVTLEDAPGGVLVIATLDDKLSWIVAPAVFVLPDHWAAGVGYAENDLFGEDKKMLLYGQIGNRASMFFGTYFDPSVRGTKLQLRFDLYALHIIEDEYANPPADPASFAVDRETTTTFLDAGALVGWQFAWWLIADLRLRGAYLYLRDVHADDAAKTPLPPPDPDGWDWSLQARMTLDHRSHRYGVTWGPYLQLILEPSVPGLDDYGYQIGKLRAYYSWRLFCEHELELRTQFHIGRHLPFHEELSNGGVQDLRGYDVDQFRGDTKLVFRAEYSVPLAKWRSLAFRAIGFWDSGFIGYYFRDPSGKRDYLPSERDGAHWFRNDVGAGLRIYVSSIVLPLLGFDVGYGIESRAPEIYFEVGLTDF